MKMTKKHFVWRLKEYIEGWIVPSIPDKTTQILLVGGSNVITANDKLLDALTGNKIFQALIQEDETGMCDPIPFLEGISEGIRKYGPLEVTIPGIPFLSKGEKTLSFGNEDIDELEKILREGGGHE